MVGGQLASASAEGLAINSADVIESPLKRRMPKLTIKDLTSSVLRDEQEVTSQEKMRQLTIQNNHLQSLLSSLQTPDA